MKIERINDNQIKCTLTGNDLSARNLSLTELAYGTDKARSLFQEMLQKASTETGFDAEDAPLMVEAIPLSGESLMLIITKVDDPEELDARFSRFSPSGEEESPANAFSSELLEGAEQLLQFLSKAAEQAAPNPPKDSPENGDAKEQGPVLRIFRFRSLDEVIHAAGAAAGGYTGASTLYKNPEDSSYYLVLREQTESESFARTCNLLSEFSQPVKTRTAGTEAYYEEHYERILGDSALHKLARI
ncbi:MAG: adaptor protein MecA [Clostridium sp.]|nr:adaptor protein MecA [Clostridium sp.]